MPKKNITGPDSRIGGSTTPQSRRGKPAKKRTRHTSSTPSSRKGKATPPKRGKSTPLRNKTRRY